MQKDATIKRSLPMYDSNVVPFDNSFREVPLNERAENLQQPTCLLVVCSKRSPAQPITAAAISPQSLELTLMIRVIYRRIRLQSILVIAKGSYSIIHHPSRTLRLLTYVALAINPNPIWLREHLHHYTPINSDIIGIKYIRAI